VTLSTTSMTGGLPLDQTDPTHEPINACNLT
jgi:hypothetical protein